MTKIAFLSFKSLSPWVSCQGLSADLARCYYEAYGEGFQHFEVSNRETEWDELVEAIIRFQPEIVVLGDHRLRIPLWIYKIKTRLKNPVTWGLHTFGCFSARMGEWMTAAPLLKDEKVIFFTGSEVQRQFVTPFFAQPENIICLPFPYDSSKDTFDLNKRMEIRAQYHIGEEEQIYLYTGRISFQKNVHHLVKLFSQNHRQNKKAHLFICGKPDDMNWRMEPHGYYLNYAAELFFESLRLAESLGASVHYLGQKNQDELHGIYCAADRFISLSTFDGEDYGRSVAEALSHGLPCVLTSWGGFKDFARLSSVKSVQVKHDGRNLQLNQTELMLSFQSSHLTDRSEVTQEFSNEWGMARSIIRLKNYYQSPIRPFAGMSHEANVFLKHLVIEWPQTEYFKHYERFLYPYWA
jgi:hypothetical protein